MASYQVNPSAHDGDNEPNHDQQPTTVPPTKIIDLNDDCLVKIFGHLDLKSLFNVAVANEWLRPAAGKIYERKFGAKAVQMFGCHGSSCNGLMQNAKFITVYGLKACLQFLRCFGSSFDNLVIDYNKSDSKRYQYVHQYMSVFCAASLSNIRFRNMPSIVNDSNVKPAESGNCDLGQQWSLQHLKEISIGILNEIRTEEFLKSVKSSLQSIRQLKHLEIHTTDDTEIPMTSLLEWTKHNLQIAKLVVKQNDSKKTIEVDSVEVQQLITEHPALVEVDLGDYRFNVDDASAVIHGLKTLKKLRFQMLHADYTHFVKELRIVWEGKCYRESKSGITGISIVELKR